ncbi:MAG TPA: hypothetical protein VJ810_35940 [Blastocatellia bacterium]|nr:hypothetical protein [Blastocatellia bacterium]
MKKTSIRSRWLLALIPAALLLSVTPFRAGTQWIEVKSAHFTVFYQAGYEKDAEFTRAWLGGAEGLMKAKYGVTPDHYYMSIYLLPEPAGDINAAQSGQNRCCTRTSAGIKAGTIKLLTISAPLWKTADLKSSLGLPKSGEDYHAKVLMSEYIPIGHYAAQDSRASGGWEYYSAPEWFVQGLQEYDGIFHTTDSNRTMTARRLLEWAKHNPTKFSCCSPKLAITDAYNGGATFMAFLAAEFGEDIHARLLRNPAKTFEVALASETKPLSLAELFDRFRKWLDRIRP